MSTKTLTPKTRCVVPEEQHLRLTYDIHTNAKTPAFTHARAHTKSKFKKKKKWEWRGVEGRRGGGTQSTTPLTLYSQGSGYKREPVLMSPWETRKDQRTSLINPSHVFKLHLQQRPNLSFRQRPNSPFLPPSGAKSERQT